ncbi:MAG: radical SAM protein [Nanoarchaeota archaeon]|nr:radical SAM protein [Nanoarchaeota archaeon]
MAYADIKLGYTCNNNCIHCVIADQREFALKTRGNQDRSTDEYKIELYKSRLNGCNIVTFTGGEPTIRKDILELIRYAKLLGFDISMQTNGRMFYYKEFAEKAASIADINYVVALHSHKKEIHESITRAEGSFEQTVTGIKNLIALDQKLIGKVVISKKNIKHLKELMQFFIELNIKEVNMAFPHAQGNAWKYFDDVVPRYTELAPFVHKTIDFIEKYNKENNENIKIEFEAIPLCFMQGYKNYVSELKFLGKKYSELKALDGRVINWEQARKEIKRKFSQCKKCKYESICEGPWSEYVEKYGDNEFKEIKS